MEKRESTRPPSALVGAQTRQPIRSSYSRDPGDLRWDPHESSGRHASRLYSWPWVWWLHPRALRYALATHPSAATKVPASVKAFGRLPMQPISAFRESPCRIARRLRLGPLFALAITALFLFPVSTAAISASTVAYAQASFSCSEIRIDAGQLQTPLFAAFDLSKSSGVMLFQFTARSLTVNWTKYTFLEVVHPLDPSSVLYRVEIDYEQGERQFRAVVGNGSAVASDSEFWLTNPTGTASWRQDASQATLAPAAPGARLAETRLPLSADATRLGNHVAAGLTNGSSTFEGNLTALMWGANLTIQNASGSETFRSGAWTEKVGPPGGRVQYRFVQELRVDFSNAVLGLSLEGRQAFLYAANFAFTGNGPTSFHAVAGFAEFDGTRRELPALLELSGNLSFGASNRTGLLYVDLSAPPPALGFAPAQRTAPSDSSGHSIPATRPSAEMTVLGMGLSSVALIGFIGLAARRRRLRAVQIEDVEMALFTGQNAKAMRMARVLVARQPKDPDAVFLYGASLAVVKGPAVMLAELEPLVNKLPLGRRAGAAFLLAQAALRIGDNTRALFWGTEAARDPILRKRLANDALESVGRGVPDFAYG